MKFTLKSIGLLLIVGIGYLFLWSIAKGYILLCKKEGMGLGDCKLLAMFGAWVGAVSLLNVLLFYAELFLPNL